jgi:negative regulator of sigma E activity
MLKKLISRLMLFVVSLFIIGLGTAGSGHAAEFSADMIQKSPMGNTNGKVFVKGEMAAGGEQNMAPPTPEEMQKIGDKKDLGEEKVNGYKCKKFRYTSKDPSVGTTTMWISKKLNFPIKTEMEGSSGPMSMEYKNIQEKELPDSLFEIPAGYQKMSMPSMPNMPGMPKQ